MTPEVINYMWGFVGFLAGVFFATSCLVVATFYDATHHRVQKKEERQKI